MQITLICTLYFAIRLEPTTKQIGGLGCAYAHRPVTSRSRKQLPGQYVSPRARLAATGPAAARADRVRW
jgi:hypothetical protein